MRHNDSAIALKTEAPLTAAAAQAWIELIVELGINADRDGLLALARQAVDQGASPILAEIACDEDAPMNARLRALGHLAVVI
jgi:hypothetical protein